MPEVSRVLGNIDKFEPANLRFDDADVPDVRVSDIMAVRETAPHMLGGFAERARAFVEVQNGCDHRCTFCIIPYGRGNSRSEEHTSELQSLMRISNAGFCLKKKKHHPHTTKDIRQSQ